MNVRNEWKDPSRIQRIEAELMPVDERKKILEQRNVDVLILIITNIPTLVSYVSFLERIKTLHNVVDGDGRRLKVWVTISGGFSQLMQRR